MDSLNLNEDAIESVDNVIFRVISEIRDKSKRPDEARIYNFIKDFLDDSGLSDGFFWEKMKILEEQRALSWNKI